jgi:hypothetical protein
MMMYYTSGNSSIFNNFLLSFYRSLYNSLSLNHISNLNWYHFSSFYRNSLFIFSSVILDPFYWYLFISNYWNHFYSFYWNKFSSLLFLIFCSLISHIVNYCLWNYFLSLLSYIICPFLFHIISPLLWYILNNCLRNIINLSFVSYLRMMFSNMFNCV